MKANVYELITERIISEIETSGLLPWRRPWSFSEGSILFPMNFSSRNLYRGINIVLLAFCGFRSPFWLTYRQCAALGGQVRKGQKGAPIIYWEGRERGGKGDDASSAAAKREYSFFIKYSTVFNVEQCDGLELGDLPQLSIPSSGFERAQAIVEGYETRPEIEHRLKGASYMPGSDVVQMPYLSDFESTEEYYSVLFHELVHSTGHATRLNRKGITDVTQNFGGETYGKEELIAEIGASFLCAESGLSPVTHNNSVAYIKGWIEGLRAEPRMLVEAASQAQKACDLILGRCNSNFET